MAENVTWQKMMDKSYVGEWCFENLTGDLVVTIKYVVTEEVIQPSTSKKVRKMTLVFAEIPEKLVCNTTNAKTIAAMHGSNTVSTWVGKKIALYYDKTVRFGRETVGGVRIRPTAPTDDYFCADCGVKIEAESGMTAKQIADYTQKRFSRCLCPSCAHKITDGGES